MDIIEIGIVCIKWSEKGRPVQFIMEQGTYSQEGILNDTHVSSNNSGI